MLHWAFTFRTKLAVRAGLRKKKKTPSQIDDLMSQTDEVGWDNFVAYTAAKDDVEIPKFGGETEATDGSVLKQIIEAIEQFLASPQGQALIQALIAALLAGL